MRRMFRATILILAIAVASTVKSAEAISWTVESTMDDQIFPSLVYAMANLKGEKVKSGTRTVTQYPPEIAPAQNFAKRPVYVQFSGETRGAKAAIRVKCDSIMEPVTLNDIDLSRTQKVSIPFSFNYDTLIQTKQSKPVNIDVSVSIDGGPFRKKSKTLTIRPVNDCPFFVVSQPSSGRGSDLSWMFAAYVNEDHPMVDEVLKIALSTGIVKSFSGYQRKRVEDVQDQVRAVWTALSIMGIRYSSITASANRSDIALSQHVRLVGESSKANQANCVDGSVLIASVLEKIGIETELVKVPGHMYVRFWLDPWLGDEKKHYCCLETTLLGEGFPAGKTPRAAAIEAADKSYQHAWNYANQAFDKNRQKFSSGSNHSYTVISINDARKRGIIPIPYIKS